MLGFEFPVTWFSTLDGILTIVGTLIAVRVWAWQDRRRRSVSGGEDLGRIAFGCALGVGGFLLLSLAASGTGKTSPMLSVGFFLLADFAIPWVDTVIMALVSRAAPAAVNTTMLGVYYLAVAAANLMVGWVGAFYEGISPARFWLLQAGIIGSAIVFLLLAGRSLARILKPRPAEAEPAG